jgi:hypothetical protein
VVLAVAAAVLPTSAGVVERWYSTWWYPAVQRTVTPVSNVAPFAFLDLFVIAAVAFALATAWRGVRRARRAKRPSPLVAAVFDLLTAGAVVYLLFLALWGLNYRRIPVIERLALSQTVAGRDAARMLGLEAVRQINQLHVPAHDRPWQGHEWRDAQMRDALASTQRLLGDATPARPGRLKWTIFGPYFRWAGVDGMIDPLALEALGNPDLLPWERPFVTAHEWAHLAGYAHEGEASFVGWLICQRGGVQARYSAWLSLYWELAAAIPASDRQQMAAALDAGPKRDLEAIAERLRRGHVPVLQRASWQVYDHYLQANRVEEGIRSYGEVVDLILRVRFEEGWVPVRRPAR